MKRFPAAKPPPNVIDVYVATLKETSVDGDIAPFSVLLAKIADG